MENKTKCKFLKEFIGFDREKNKSYVINTKCIYPYLPKWVNKEDKNARNPDCECCIMFLA